MEVAPSTMTKEQVESLLRAALNDLQMSDAHLLNIRANERSMTHRLAVHLERRLQPMASGWSVDCEFNRDGGVPKRLLGHSEEYARGGSAHDLVMDDRGRTVFPDIIIQARGEKGPNLLVIEAKWDGATANDIELDRQKLRAYVEEYRYRHAYLVLFQINRCIFERVDLPRNE